MNYPSVKHPSNYKSPLVLLCILFLYACGRETPVPKPVGYFRIDLPTPKYQHKSPDCPFEFDISEYSRLELIVDTAHPLNELGDFIDKNGHLPKMPSTDQIKEEGLATCETIRLLTEKVEELTLYLLEQRKEIELLREEINKN
ncbi:hypothetical protein G3O08_19310 [Cryomorpha ignava]|uniref:Uncharacterized protein n=1 Tax=Cryomorpha ignava TaxID=101383 RepID=A0A7K3WVV7_9FLAO|nr:hypothetical protein [Cryomorpha ignava]NEN25646.1 hypothetical protein [Cryomorpha ignava]